MDIRLFDSEIKLMDLIWAHEPLAAKDLSLLAAEQLGWNKNTTYTVVKKLIDKGVVSRSEPGFICTALVKKTEVRLAETESLIRKFFGGSRQALFSALLADEKLSPDELAELRRLIDQR